MKSFTCLLFTLLILSLHCQAQTSSDDSLIGTRVWKVPLLPVENDKIVYSGTEILRPDPPKAYIYRKIYDYFKYNMTSGDVKISVADSAAGHIAGLGKITYNQSVLKHDAAQAIYFNYDIWIEQGKYRYRITDIKGLVGADRLDYSYMYQEEMHPVSGHEHWDHKYRYEMLSDMDSFIKLMIGGIRSNAAVSLKN